MILINHIHTETYRQNVTLNASKNKSARLDYSKVLDIKHKPHKPLSRDIEDEVRDMSDSADIQFTPDFDPL